MRSQLLAVVPRFSGNVFWCVRQLGQVSTFSASAPPPARQKGTMKMATTTSPWLKVSEVLEELSIGRSTFDLWRAEGRAPRCYKLPNGQLRIKRADLDAWLSELEEVAA